MQRGGVEAVPHFPQSRRGLQRQLVPRSTAAVPAWMLQRGTWDQAVSLEHRCFIFKAPSLLCQGRNREKSCFEVNIFPQPDFLQV